MPSITAPVSAVDAVTPRSRLVTIDLAGRRLDYQPGQAIFLGTAGRRDRRPYSIASSPERTAETGRLELLIAVEDSGSLGPHLPGLQPGTHLDIDGPFGTFVFPDAPVQRDLLFVAGGAGIAPLRAMIDHTLRRHPAARVSLLYSARRGDEFAFIDELREHAHAGRIDLHDTVTRDLTWAGPRGRIARSHFEAVLHEPAATLCFVCGPPQFVAESVSTLTDFGVPRELLRTEQWEG